MNKTKNKTKHEMNILTDKDTHDTCILMPTCLAYLDAANLSVSLLNRYWATHPPVFICGLSQVELCNQDLKAQLIIRQEPNARDWIGITFEAARHLKNLGFKKVFLILDDQGPLDYCHAYHLDHTIHEWMTEMEAVYISLIGWEQASPSCGQVLGPEYLYVQRQAINFRW